MVMHGINTRLPLCILVDISAYTFSRNRVILTPGFFCPIVVFCRQVSVKIVLFVIQSENNGYICLRGFLSYRVILSHCLFFRQVTVKNVIFVIQLENNRIYLSSGFFVLSGYFVPLFIFSSSHCKNCYICNSIRK